MIRYTPTNQLSIEAFRTPFQIKLDRHNRWVKLAHLLPWDEMAAVYHDKLDSEQGAPSIDARIVIGAMIIKHKLKLDDREAIEYIRENVYVQYFLGLSDYTYENVFDRSLFTTLRYRMGEKEFDELNSIIIEQSEGLGQRVGKQGKKNGDKRSPGNDMGDNNKEELKEPLDELNKKGTGAKNKGKLQMDATVADQMIVYPTDLGLLNTSREESERLIDALHKDLSGKQNRGHTERRHVSNTCR